MKFFFALLRTSIRSSISIRRAFLLESFLMVSNNLIFVLMWWIFFRQFTSVGGWELRDMMALNAIGMGAYGLRQVCFGGAKQIARIILQGDLDPFMTQPKNLLLQLLSSRSLSKGWGHMLTAIIIIFFGKLTSLSVLCLILIATLCGTLVFASVAIIAHSLVFWFGAIEEVSKKYCDSLYLFALYPSNIYKGLLQLVMFTVLPAGIIGYLPVEILRDFSFFKLCMLLITSIGFFTLSFVVFYAGLKRYESGNQFGMRL